MPLVPSPETKLSNPRPINSWALSSLIHLDEASPGILRFATLASPLRRQGIFLALSQIDWERPSELAARLRPATEPKFGTDEAPLAEIARHLKTQRVREIAISLHGHVKGLFGALNRIGDNPLEPAEYQCLVDLLTKPEHNARAAVLRQTGRIDSSILTVLRELRPAFVHTDIVKRFHSTGQVEEFSALINLIHQIVPGTSDEELVASLRAIGHSHSSLRNWSGRWVAKAACFPVFWPHHDDEEFVALRTGQSLLDAGIRFNKCLKSKVSMCAVGRVAYAEYKPSPAIVEFASLSHGRWVLQGIYGPANKALDAEVTRTIRSKLHQRGILVPARLAKAQRYNRAARMLRIYDYDGIDLDALDGEQDGMQALDEELQEIEREIEAA
jgi:hypothetical protein